MAHTLKVPRAVVHAALEHVFFRVVSSSATAFAGPTQYIFTDQKSDQHQTSASPKSLNAPLVSHADLEVPDFSPYRRRSLRDPTVRSKDSQAERYGFTYLMTGSMTVASLYCAKKVVAGAISFIGPAADAIAEGTVEVKLEKIKEGKNMVFKWRDKPVFVRHREQEEIDKERSVDISQLRDPEKDEDRVQRPQWLVVVGVRSHSFLQ